MTYCQFYRQYFYELSVFYFIVGACIGSFLNVCIWRIPKGESIVTPGSHCPSCKSQIKPTDNIPILSWLLLRGRCRHCQTAISPRYILIEFITAGIFVCVLHRIFLKSWPISLLIPFSFIAASSIAIVLIDSTYFIIPNLITISGLILALVWGLLFPSSHSYGLVNTFFFELIRENLQTSSDFQHQGLFANFMKLPSLFSAINLTLGGLFGGGFLLFFGKLGGLIFGTKRITRNNAVEITISSKGFRTEKEGFVPWSRFFKTGNDRLKIYGKLRQANVDGSDEVFQIEKDQMEKEQRFFVTKDRLWAATENHSLDHVNVVIESRYWVFYREVMGMGDVKLMAMFGAFLGPIGAFFIITLSSLLGTLFSVVKGAILVTLFSRHWETRMPYGPFIAMAGLGYIFFGEELIYLLFPNNWIYW